MKMNKRLAGLLNTPAQRWSPLLLRLQAYWRQLAPRERKILAGGGLALCLALTWQVFIDPPLARIEHWQAELPRLRAQAAAVDGVLREVEALRGPTLSGTADAESIRRSLRDQGLDGFQLDAPQPGQWQLDFASVSGEALLRWLARSPAALRLSVSEAQVTRLDAPSEERSGSSNELSGGLVSASIHLQSTSAPKDSP
ncbi:type II secretion system protein M [Pseudomonas aeruginosa]|uniref:type II secretion system protein M n=1 Tax=Pseudomonas aeruginosa TaxID=287 RepID=UPI0022383154|nr:type II secretion system protein GspM [Pseudomonas aeruginosa]MCW5342150.1 type II secretion system protein M [Pseudomonas aeruginosa]